jgi:hypothetical protein
MPTGAPPIHKTHKKIQVARDAYRHYRLRKLARIQRFFEAEKHELATQRRVNQTLLDAISDEYFDEFVEKSIEPFWILPLRPPQPFTSLVNARNPVLLIDRVDHEPDGYASDPEFTARHNRIVSRCTNKRRIYVPETFRTHCSRSSLTTRLHLDGTEAQDHPDRFFL